MGTMFYHRTRYLTDRMPAMCLCLRERSRLQHGTFPGAGYRVATWLEVYAGEPDMLSSRMCMCSNHPTSPGGDALLSSLRERAL